MTETVLQNLPYFWAAVGVIFLLVEVASATFYGLAVSLAAFATAGFVALAGSRQWTIPQFAVFLGASVVLCFALPRLMAHKQAARGVGIEDAIGRPARLTLSGGWKIELDGVRYLVHETSLRPDFAEGMAVKVTGVRDGQPTVE